MMFGIRTGVRTNGTKFSLSKSRSFLELLFAKRGISFSHELAKDKSASDRLRLRLHFLHGPMV
jgi:hypothetical protein